MLSRRIPRHLGGTLPFHPLSRPRVVASSIPQRETTAYLLPHLSVGSGAPSGRRHVHFVQTAIDTTQHLITGLHAATGTPWYITIPLVAVAVTLVRVPFTVYSQQVLRRRAELTPLLQAWYARHARALPLTPGMTVAQHRREVEQRSKKTMGRIFRERGLQTWRLNSGLLVFPVWALVIESIRRLCGGPVGLLGVLFPGLGGTDAAVATSPSVPSAAAAADPEAASAALAHAGAADGVVVGSAAYVDPSLATGGLLWFPDLTVPDPYHVLPMLLSGVMLMNLLPRTAAGVRAVFMPDPTGGPQPQGSSGMAVLRRSLVVMALVVGPATMNLPSAIHLYWLCSTGFGGLSTRLVAWLLPVPKTNITPCKGRERLIIIPRPQK